jgi:hypothetical protein
VGMLERAGVGFFEQIGLEPISHLLWFMAPCESPAHDSILSWKEVPDSRIDQVNHSQVERCPSRGDRTFQDVEMRLLSRDARGRSVLAAHEPVESKTRDRVANAVGKNRGLVSASPMRSHSRGRSRR